jgi:hypothetical protein
VYEIFFYTKVIVFSGGNESSAWCSIIAKPMRRYTSFDSRGRGWGGLLFLESQMIYVKMISRVEEVMARLVVEEGCDEEFLRLAVFDIEAHLALEFELAFLAV